MGIADPEAALEKLREFRGLQEQADTFGLYDALPPQLTAAIGQLEPLIEEIARAVGEERVDHVASGWTHSALAVTNRLIGTLEKQPDFQRIFDPPGPLPCS